MLAQTEMNEGPLLTALLCSVNVGYVGEYGQSMGLTRKGCYSWIDRQDRTRHFPIKDRQSGASYATACNPLRCMIDSKRRAGPPGRFTPRSQSDTRLRETLR